MNGVTRPFFVAAVAILLSACATAPPRPPAPYPEITWQTRLDEIRKIDTWKAKGKLAVNTDQRGGSANMIWERKGSEHYVNLYGPFGGGRVVLTRDAKGALLTDSKKREYRATTAEEVLRQAAGWRVPFAAMQYWILGVPAPDGKFSKTLDRYGRLQRLQQDGWDVEFVEYRFFDHRELPRKLVLTALPGNTHIVADRLGENDRVEVKVIIKGWTI